MQWGLDLTASSVPRLLAYALMLLLAGALLWLNFSNRPTRAFAALLVFRSFGGLTQTFYTYASDPAATDYWYRVHAYTGAPTILAILYFLCVYPRPRVWLGTSPWGAPVMAAIGFAVELLYVAAPTLYTTYAVAGPGQVVETAAGPLYLTETLVGPSAALAAVVFFADYLKATPGSVRSSLGLVSFGFALYIFYNTAADLVLYALHALGAQDAFHLSPLGAPLASPYAVARIALATALCTVLVTRLIRAARDADGFARKYLGLVCLPLLTVVLVTFLRLASAETAETADRAFYGFWRVWLPFIVAYALVRYRIFDIDVKLQWAIRRTTLAAAFFAVFFLVSEGTAQFLQTKTNNTLIGLVGAAFIVFLLAPLQRLADGVAQAAVPGAKPMDEMSKSERVAFYQQQVLFAVSDGTMSPDERRMLDFSRRRLGLTEDEAARLERSAAPTAR